MPLDTTIALVDEFEYVNYIGATEAEYQINNERTLMFINWASAEIKSFCGGRIFITPSAQIQEIFNGDGTRDYYTRHGHINDTTPASDVKIYLWQSNAWVEKLSADYPRSVDADKGRVWFNNGQTFYEGEDNWRLDYKPGWAIASVPADLKGVCLAVTKRLHLLAGGKEGISTESFGDATTTYNLQNLLGVTQLETLNRYKRRFL